MSIKNSIIDLVGNTPLLALRRIEKKENVDANLIAKLEYFNPAGSVKDRVAKAIILDALEKGEIDKDTTLVEPTSGNTGIGLASVAAALGMKLIITMPETMSIERRKLMKAYGAELVLTDGTKGMKGAIAKANEIVEKTPNCFIPGQFNNMVNPKTHEEITGPEIWKEAEGKVDVFVAGVGTGGTISGVGKYLKEKNPQKKKMTYDIFRQGLEIQDLDPITYQIIAKNKNSIGNWFPELTQAVKKQDFFKIPDTTIIRVPLPLLQLTKLDYMELTKTSLEIADRFCEKAFSLDRQKEYFIKTGVFSSKFDFRNAHIQGAEEVRTIGEYLLFIHFQASSMAHFDLNGRNQPVIYGPGTTVEWVCREFIQDKEQNPCIYKGLPLHTEYRVFIDADKNDVIGIAPYWDPDTMKKRFGHESDKDSPHQVHDYIIYMAHENILMKRFAENKDSVVQHIKDMLPDLNLTGQWSLDVMQNGNDFYIIDMALAAESALKKYVPKGRLHPVKEDWIPELMKRDCYK